MAERGHGLGQGLTLRQQQAHLAVAAQVARGGEHQITQARETHEGVGAGAQRQAQARHFGQAAGDERGAGVQAQIQSVAQTGGNGQHVFHRAAHFHTHDIVVGIHPQRRAVKSAHQGVAHPRLLAGSDQGGGLATGHFLRKTGATQYT